MHTISTRKSTSRLETDICLARKLEDLRRKHADAGAQQAREIERLRQVIESRRPQLVANMEQLVFGVTPNEGQFQAFILMGVWNVGISSIAHEWAIRANHPDGRNARGVLTWIDHLELFEGAGPTNVDLVGQSVNRAARVITKADALYNKTMTPIPTGGKVVGWLGVAFPGFAREELAAKGTEFIVEFKDVLGTEYSCSHVLSGPFSPLGQSPRYAGE